MTAQLDTKRLASLFRQLAQLILQIAEAFEQEAPKRPRKRHISEPETTPSPEAVDRARRALRRKGVAV